MFHGLVWSNNLFMMISDDNAGVRGRIEQSWSLLHRNTMIT